MTSASASSRYDHASRWRRRADLGGAISVYVIYRQPHDFKGYVIREFRVDADGLTPLEWVRASHHPVQLRALVGKHIRRRLNRASDDDPVILETWF